MNKFHKYLMLFHAPDTGANVVGNITAPGVDVPEIASATNTGTIEPVEIQPSGIEDIVGDDPNFGVKGPKEILGEDPDETLEAMEKDMGKQPRERGPDGKFLKKDANGKVIPAKPAPVKPVAKTPAKPVEAAPAKVKIGDDEKTPEEWQAELKALREKAETTSKPPEAKTDLDPKEQEAQAAAEEAKREQRREEFLAKNTELYTLPDKELDTILSGGKEGAAQLGRTLAKVQMHTREWMAAQHNAEMKSLRAELQPILDREKTIGQFAEENGVLESNPELKSHPKGLETYRKLKADFETSFDAIQQKGEQAGPQEKAWAIQYGAMTADERRAAIAANAKAEVAKIPTQQAAKPVNGTAPAKQPIRVTKSFNGDRPGGAQVVPKQESKDAQVLREMEATGRF